MDAVARFIAETTWDTLPAEVREKARLCMADNLAALLAGSVTRSSAIAAEFAQKHLPGTEARVLPRGVPVSTAGAAFANATAANAVDIDDIGYGTWGHPGAQLLPTALAVSESAGLGGAALLTSMVVGYEVAFREGLCVNRESPLFRACGSWGAASCAAIACHVQGTPPDQTIHALGIAEYCAPYLPMMRDIDAPTMVKHGVAWGAMAGIQAAELAELGFTAPPPSLGDESNKSYVQDIGERYLLPHGITWKEFSCCAWAHPAIMAVRGLQERHSFTADDVRSVVVRVYDASLRLGTRLPSTTEEAQFNVAWPVAVFLIDGEVGPRQVLDERLSDSKVRDLASRVTLIESDALTHLKRVQDFTETRGMDAAIVSIELTSGERLDSGVVQHVRYPDPPWDRERVEAKARWLLERHYNAVALDTLTSALWSFEEVDDVPAFLSTVCEGWRE